MPVSLPDSLCPSSASAVFEVCVGRESRQSYHSQVDTGTQAVNKGKDLLHGVHAGPLGRQAQRAPWSPARLFSESTCPRQLLRVIIERHLLTLLTVNCSNLHQSRPLITIQSAWAMWQPEQLDEGCFLNLDLCTTHACNSGLHSQQSHNVLPCVSHNI